jgi:hypothetical protein
MFAANGGWRAEVSATGNTRFGEILVAEPCQKRR